MRLRIARGQRIGGALVIAILLGNAGLALYNIRRVSSAAEWVGHTREVLADLEAVLSTLKDAEAEQRGFLITGDQGYLAPYERAVEAVASRLARVEALTVDNPTQHARAATLAELVGRRLEGLRQVVAEYQEDPEPEHALAAARERIHAGGGRQAMEAARALVLTMEGEETALLRAREAQAAGSLRAAVASTLVALALGIVLIAGTVAAASRYEASRRLAASALSAERERLHTTLTSIGDGVIVTDASGRITLMNPVARDLTGWGEDAVGQPLDGVFRIVGEQSRAPVTSQIARAPREGAGARPPEHVALIARDGGETPVDARGAPIRDAAGGVIGAVTVFRDVTDQRRAERQLEDADRRKDEFLAVLAHELRNPLAPIRSAAHTLGLLGGADARVGWIAGVLERQTRHITRLVDDLLDVSRIASGKITLHREVVRVGDVVAQAVEAAGALARARGQALEIDVPDDAGRVHGDPARLAQAIGNLLDNAVKYTAEGRRIWLTAGRRDGEAVISVRDEGAGIAPDLLPRVFDLFTQADHTLERTRGGLGIGLTLARRLVEMHGGTVVASSDGPGRGSEFVIRLPALPDAVPVTAVADAGPGAADDSRTSRILVVDDQPDSTETLALFLRLRGHEVRTAPDGPTALQEALLFRPEAVVLDLGLPGVNGFDVARRLRAMPEMAGLTLVALTGYATDADRRRSAEAGFDAHLAKPVDPNALEAVLDALAARRTG